MSELVNRAYRMVFNTVTRPDGSTLDVTVRKLDVNLIVMSRDTFRKLLRDDTSLGLVRLAPTKDQPDRIGPARVAFDDSMSLGQMIVAEATGDIG